MAKEGLPLVEVRSYLAKETLSSGKLRLEDDSLNFDYAHFLPAIEKCSTIHGHSSRVIVEVEGVKDANGVIVDFGILKKAVREAIAKIDHKLIICRKYVSRLDSEKVVASFTGRGGEYRLEIPASQALITDFESTVENIATLISEYVLDRMPGTVLAVKVSVSEGIGKSAEVVTIRRRNV